jgi:hypothetical protein
MRNLLLAIFSAAIFTTSATAQKSKTYPVIVSFNSMCCGVPDNAPVMKFVSKFKKQYKLKQVVVDSIGPFGREGEYYLAFCLKEMNKKQKMAFIKQLKITAETMKDKGSADVRENETVDLSGSSRVPVTTTKLKL